MSSKPKFAYEKRLLLFLDILGFREIVERTVEELDYLGKVINALDRIGELADDAGLQKSSVVTQFSDSIVVSYRVDEESGVFHLLTKIAFCVVDLISLGFLVRGAVTIGDLYHDEHRIVGPAMVRAYEMESKNAIYPRVIVDAQIFKVARQYRGDIHEPEEEEEYVQHYLTKDDDGWMYYNYVSWEKVVDVTGLDNDAYGEYLFALYGIIKAGLAHKDDGVRKKYQWLHKQYVAAIEQVEDLPEQHPYRLENWEMCDAIAELPKLIDEAK